MQFDIERDKLQQGVPIYRKLLLYLAIRRDDLCHSGAYLHSRRRVECKREHCILKLIRNNPATFVHKQHLAINEKLVV